MIFKNRKWKLRQKLYDLLRKRLPCDTVNGKHYPGHQLRQVSPDLAVCVFCDYVRPMPKCDCGQTLGFESTTTMCMNCTFGKDGVERLRNLTPGSALWRQEDGGL